MLNFRKHFRSVCDSVKNDPLTVIFPLMLIVTATYISLICSSELAVRVDVNGQPYGYINSMDTVINAEAEIDRKIYTAAGESYTESNSITYSFDFVKNPEYLTEDECTEILWSYLEDDFCEAYMLYVDDVHAAANESGYNLYNLLNTIEAELLESAPKDFSQVKFSNRLRLEKQLCAKSYIKTIAEINTLLNPLAEEQRAVIATYAAKALEKPKDVSVRIGAFSAATFVEGDKLAPVVSASGIPGALALEYSFVETQVVDEVILYDTVYNNDDALFEGTEIVTVEGVCGKKVVEYEVLYDDNGDTVARNIKNETIVVPAIDKVVTVGTRVKPEPVPTGTFIWPCEAPMGVTSYYGWRELNGRPDYHLGIDMPDKLGSPIWAADGGEVVWAGSSYSYGNSVRVQHDNNKVTVYAHLDTISVNVGDMVFQGQEIGTMGHTGVAYGTHLHFEIRINGGTVNPLKYLPEK